MKLAIGGDHGAYDLKVDLVEHLRSQGHEVVDLGAHNAQRTDYPVYGRAVGEAVVAGEVEALKAAWQKAGCTLPYMGFNLIPLSVIPEIRITDKGLVLVPEMTQLPLFAAE